MENTKPSTFAGSPASSAKDTQRDNRFSPRAIDAQDSKFDDGAAQQSSKAQPFQSSSKSQSGASAPSTGSARGSETTASSAGAAKKSGKSASDSVHASSSEDVGEDVAEDSEPAARGRGAGRAISTAKESGGDNKGEVSASSQSEWLSDITDQAQGFDTQFKSFVVQRPLVIMGAALAVGYLANRFLISRASSQAAKGA